MEQNGMQRFYTAFNSARYIIAPLVPAMCNNREGSLLTIKSVMKARWYFEHSLNNRYNNRRCNKELSTLLEIRSWKTLKLLRRSNFSSAEVSNWFDQFLNFRTKISQKFLHEFRHRVHKEFFLEFFQDCIFSRYCFQDSSRICSENTQGIFKISPKNLK